MHRKDLLMRLWKLAGIVIVAFGAIGLVAGSAAGLLPCALLGACVTLPGGALFWGLSRLFRSFAVWVRSASAVAALAVASVPLSYVLHLCEPQRDGGQVFSPAFALIALPVVAVAIAFGAGYGQRELR